MAFPAYVHSVVKTSDEAAWPVQGQGPFECGCTVAANALNLVAGRRLYDKNDFVHAAGVLFQPNMGTPSPFTGRLIQQHGGGTHFGNLSYTDVEGVLRDLIDRGVPVVVEIGVNKVGPWRIYGEHSILLVGYSDLFKGPDGAMRQEYYFVDSQYPELGTFSLASNDVVINGVKQPFPGNRTMAREEFLRLYQMGIYFPVFRSQAEHDAWYAASMRTLSTVPLFGMISSRLFNGSYDLWNNARKP